MADGAPAPRFRIVPSTSRGDRPTSNVTPQDFNQRQRLSQGNINQVQNDPPNNNGQPFQPMNSQAVPPNNATVSQAPQPEQSPAPDAQASTDQVIAKCVRFFRTLINLSQQPDSQSGTPHNPHTAGRVNQLVTSVIFGQMPPEDFTRNLQEALQSQAQPHLLPFLRRTLPTLRNALQNGEVTIDGITPPPGFVIANNQNIQQPQYPAVSTPHAPMTVRQPVSNQFQNFPASSASTSMTHQGPPAPQFVSSGRPEPVANPVEEKPAVNEELYEERPLQESVLKPSILRPEDIMKKITQRMNEACYVEEDVLTLISDAAEYRLRELLGELAVLAEHRVDPLRLNSNYVAIDDTRRQIRFLEDIDRQNEEQRESREKEAIIRLNKSKGSGKEPISKELAERAKEIQRQDAEAKRNRDANAAAIAALSSNKSSRAKWDQMGTHGAVNITRPRTVRVNIRDFHSLVNNDPKCSRSHIVHKLALCGGTQTDTV